MKKLLLVIALLLMMVGCGKDNVSGNNTDPSSNQYISQSLSDVGLSLEFRSWGPELVCRNTILVSNDIRLRALENLLSVLSQRQAASSQEILITFGRNEVPASYLMNMFHDAIVSLSRYPRTLNDTSCVQRVLAKLIRTKPRYYIQKVRG